MLQSVVPLMMPVLESILRPAGRLEALNIKGACLLSSA